MRSARALFLSLVLAGLAAAAAADDAMFEHVKRLTASGLALLEAPEAQKDPEQVRRGVGYLARARNLCAEVVRDPANSPESRAEAEDILVQLETNIRHWTEALSKMAPPDGPSDGEDPRAGPEDLLPAPTRGEALPSWARKAKDVYLAQEDPALRAALADRMAAKAGRHAIDALIALLRVERDPKARKGLQEALAGIGGGDVARTVSALSGTKDDRLKDDALEVVYACLAKPERTEPEKPWCAAVRAFHRRKDKDLSLRILGRLDGMGWSGIAALGEILYLDDFGCQKTAIEMLAKKRDSRAVPPLVHKMDRFSFEFAEQFPAHKALLEIGWHAVPELIRHLDDPAAGIWISWTLRKITGETMGTTWLKWDDWWKAEKKNHPEVGRVPEEGPRKRTPEGGETTPK